MNIIVFIFGVIVGFVVALMIAGFITNADRLDSRNNLEAKVQELEEALYTYQGFILDSGFTALYRAYVDGTSLGNANEEDEGETDEWEEDEADEWKEDEADE